MGLNWSAISITLHIATIVEHVIPFSGQITALLLLMQRSSIEFDVKEFFCFDGIAVLHRDDCSERLESDPKRATDDTNCGRCGGRRGGGGGGGL
ncbi:hypothetical protein KIN20_030694 [Parelaphostrongylus tenuis]|uniref:Uncharacterized protein n=1 Tax=Parelaphostrongylus tenuis TaxID=148309 RepID=A0AAD5WGN7_PARTN|nr:hypothetical protein KIN20_030694 [Parelaphostrongylus tenuis]